MILARFKFLKLLFTSLICPYIQRLSKQEIAGELNILKSSSYI